jgi:hypothetical protein
MLAASRSVAGAPLAIGAAEESWLIKAAVIDHADKEPAGETVAAISITAEVTAAKVPDVWASRGEDEDAFDAMSSNSLQWGPGIIDDAMGVMDGLLDGLIVVAARGAGFFDFDSEPFEWKGELYVWPWPAEIIDIKLIACIEMPEFDFWLKHEIRPK